VPGAGSRARHVLGDALVQDESAGMYRLPRSIRTDEEIYELETMHLFEGNCRVHLADDSQFRGAGDYFTTHIGRQPFACLPF
jgi:benzoate/toluate 1,2-dioxygenase subunit alpha